MKFRRNRRNPATGPVPTPAPQSPHAATVPDPTALYAADHLWLPSTAEGMRAHAERCLGHIADAYTKIDELHDWIQHWQAEAADYRRAADLVELDGRASAAERTARPGAAMGRDELLSVSVGGFPVHFDDGVSFLPPCNTQDPMVSARRDPAEVTCGACRAWLERRAQSSPGVEPRPAWHPAGRSASDDLSAQDGDTVPMRAVRTCIAGAERGGVVYHCSRDEGHSGLHFGQVIGEFVADAEAVSR